MKYYIDNVEVNESQFIKAKNSGRFDINGQNLTTKSYIKIQELKDKLAQTDYKAIKYAEGQLSEEEYAPIKAQRQEWRDEINRLENTK